MFDPKRILVSYKPSAPKRPILTLVRGKTDQGLYRKAPLQHVLSFDHPPCDVLLKPEGWLSQHYLVSSFFDFELVALSGLQLKPSYCKNTTSSEFLLF